MMPLWPRVEGQSVVFPAGSQQVTALVSEQIQQRKEAVLRFTGRLVWDEARTVRDLKAHQTVVLPMIGQNGGRIIDTAGDGFFAAFDGPIRAIRRGWRRASGRG